MFVATLPCLLYSDIDDGFPFVYLFLNTSWRVSVCFFFFRLWLSSSGSSVQEKMLCWWIVIHERLWTAQHQFSFKSWALKSKIFKTVHILHHHLTKQLSSIPTMSLNHVLFEGQPILTLEKLAVLWRHFTSDVIKHAIVLLVHTAFDCLKIYACLISLELQ